MSTIIQEFLGAGPRDSQLSELENLELGCRKLQILDEGDALVTVSDCGIDPILWTP